MAHPIPVKEEGVRWWMERCGRRQIKNGKEVVTPCRSHREQIAVMGCDAVTVEEWHQKYGHDVLLTREEMVIFLFKMKHATAKDVAAYISQSQASSSVVEATIKKVREYLNIVVDEIRWSDRLNPCHHSPHFPYLVTHFTDSVPFSPIGGALFDVLFDPKYAGHVWKLTVAVDHLGNIVWIDPLMPGTPRDVIKRDKYGPSRKLGLFKDFEVGNHDGAYNGRPHAFTYSLHRPQGSYET